MFRVFNTIASSDRFVRQCIRISADALMLILALWLSFSVRLSEFYYLPSMEYAGLWLAAIAVGILIFFGSGQYRPLARYFDGTASIKLMLAMGAAAATWMALAHLSGLPHLPRSVGLIYWANGFCFTFGLRYIAFRLLATTHAHQTKSRPEGTPLVRIAIYGAGETGYSLAQSLQTRDKYKIVAFLDDDPALIGRTVADVPVYSTEDPAFLQHQLGIEQFYLALPSASRFRRIEIIQKLEKLPVEVKTVPSYYDIVAGRFAISDVRSIDIDFLLCREPVEPRAHLINEAVLGKTLLVTGAGGSIGSELCRQIAGFGARKLVLLEHSEYALYAIHAELSESFTDRIKQEKLVIVPILGSILNERLVHQTLLEHRTDTIFHTAAYKHVPLIEDNILVGVHNNVIGTKILADTAADLGVDRFIMISTDKAVRPTSIMGASKRVSELYLQALADDPAIRTLFSIVRFGNVLASSGSVVPLFTKQIQAGGPVTVTHKDVTRFFMSIPEASQLVLQATTMARGGEVFVLDMGDPVKIHDLARMMINLSGLTVCDQENPDGDIEIVVTGLRPGEKLYEELFVGVDLTDTDHPRIMRARENRRRASLVFASMKEAEKAIERGDVLSIEALLMSLVETIEARPVERRPLLVAT